MGSLTQRIWAASDIKVKGTPFRVVRAVIAAPVILAGVVVLTAGLLLGGPIVLASFRETMLLHFKEGK